MYKTAENTGIIYSFYFVLYFFVYLLVMLTTSFGEIKEIHYIIKLNSLS